MRPSKKRRKRKAPVGGRPVKGGRPTTGAVRTNPNPPKRPPRAPTKSYTQQDRVAAVEAYHKSGLTQREFGWLWGISKATLGNWVRKYRTEGPKSLERKPYAGKGKGRLATALTAEILRTKSLFPDFGLKRIRDYLKRFRSVQVSPGAIQKTLETAQVSTPSPAVIKKPKKKKPVRRFERSKPGALWQSDITSFVLARHGTRVYLTVFLDDFSRYVVSFAMALHQKGELVTEALLSGLDRFGKPEEVLTDQGRQYYAWRGKSGFQKLLEKQGIRHVVARSHHPQTVGKSERLWKTIQEEFWSRVHPQELEEARRRMDHFFVHYNHSRPHQGIGGLVPADRFFGAQSEVRQALEAQQEENALRLALGEEPRRSVYLVGRIGDQEVSMHGERGQLVIHAPEAEAVRMNPDQMGMAREESNGRRVHGIEEEPKRPSTEIDALQDAETGGPVGPGALGVGPGRGAKDRPSDGSGDPGTLAGPGEPEGSGGAPRGASASRVAAVAAGADGLGGGSFEAAEEPEQSRGLARGGKPLETEGPDGETGAGCGEPAEPREAVEGTPGASVAPGGPGGERCPEEGKGTSACPESRNGGSGDGFASREPEKENERPWPEPTESRSEP